MYDLNMFRLYLQETIPVIQFTRAGHIQQSINIIFSVVLIAQTRSSDTSLLQNRLIQNKITVRTLAAYILD